MAEKPLVLVIDDETGSRESMAIAIEKAGLAVRTFDDAPQGARLPRGERRRRGWRSATCACRAWTASAFLNEVRERELRPRRSSWSPAYGSIESAVEAMRVGADDYLTKPVDLYELRQRVMNLLEKQQLKEEVIEPAPDARQALRLREHHRPLGADGAPLRADAAGGADALDAC